MGKLNKKALLISLVLTILCALVLFNYIRNLQKPIEETTKTEILVSIKDINPGELIMPEDIRIIKVSPDSVPEGIIFDKTYIEGMYAKMPILIGEPFREQKLSKREELSLSYRLDKGYRAVSVFINEANALSMQLVPGDMVDVIASWLLVTSDEGTDIPMSYTVLQNIEVLSLGPNRVADEKSGMPSRDSYNIDDLPKTITLAVTLEQAETLALNSVNSTLSIALRGLGDDEIQNTKGAIVYDQLSDRLVPIALKPGDKKDETTDTSAATSNGGASGLFP